MVQVSRVMRLHLTIVSACVCAGGLGGVINVLLRPLWTLLHLAGSHGLLTSLRLPFSAGEIYHQAFWGALWGLIFLAPLHRTVKNFWLRSVIYGVAPTLVALIIVIPSNVHDAGVLCVNLGMGTPLLVLLANTVGWSLPAYAWMKLLGFAGGLEGGVSDDEPPLLLQAYFPQFKTRPVMYVHRVRSASAHPQVLVRFDTQRTSEGTPVGLGSHSTFCMLYGAQLVVLLSEQHIPRSAAWVCVEGTEVEIWPMCELCMSSDSAMLLNLCPSRQQEQSNDERGQGLQLLTAFVFS
eukprot:TRINITY_DN12020_c1_g2_i2.p1 TRINITY_DN12020_c1_g2~~TRINITY_DN12020_c1_g2_i2.p1  ORF type:complete len:340 (-),score=15.39 TRINITY_DN12020_c1_g2_i2:65-943(-)